jgi:ribosomal protein S18 acetylase RimI-like enzyme
MGFFPELKEHTKHMGSIWGAYVVPEARGTGLGKSLMQAVIEEVRQAKFEQIKLSVESENIAALRLYEAMGFKIFGEEPRALKVDGKYFNETHMILLLQG